MKVLVFDTESDGLAYEATKIHVMSWTWNGEDYYSTNNYDKMKEVLNEADLLVCHNSIRHDMPLLNRILETTLQYNEFADSLALSWYLHFERQRHGLESYGKDFGVPKPKVTDWNNLSYETYAHRCEEDVKINHKLWQILHAKLIEIYGEEKWTNAVEYLSFKMDCAREQEQVRWKLDVKRAEEEYGKLINKSNEKSRLLSKSMPKVPTYKTLTKPKVLYKKDGTLSVNGQGWFNNLRKAKLPMTHKEDFRIVVDWSEGNPNSTPQIKDWLFTLGWKPSTFKYVKNNDGTERKIPQIRYPKGHPEEGHLCSSVTVLKSKDKRIEVLEGLTVINHRKSFFKAMLDAEQGGYIKATVAGLTNTLRFKHNKPLANIPGVDKPYGEEIRGCLLAPDDDHTLCGADMSSLESVTKRHFMMPYDPEYVKEMSQDDFDEHLDLAVRAGSLTKSDYDYYGYTKDESDKDYQRINKIRKKFKPVNYGSVYGIGAQKLSREMGIPFKEAVNMIKTYWDRNWAVKKLAKDQYVKKLGREMWLQNPVSGIYHNLRYDKDRFSTLNQSTGVYCFDLWTKYIREQGVSFCGQFHDEHISPTLKGDEERKEKIYQEALEKTNKELMLRVPLGMEAKYGRTYAEIH